jgi:hypothetical protein
MGIEPKWTALQSLAMLHCARRIETAQGFGSVFPGSYLRLQKLENQKLLAIISTAGI